MYLTRACMPAVTWGVLMFSQVVPALALGSLATLAAVCLHGVLLNPTPPRSRLLTPRSS